VRNDRMSATALNKPPENETRALRVEVIKPLNKTWDEAGARLRALRTIAHRVQQAVFLACCAQERAQRKAGGAKAAKLVGIDGPRTEAYRVAAEEIEAIRAWAKSKLEDKQDGAVMRELATLEISSALQLGMCGAGFAGFVKWSKDKQRNAMPEWRRGAPIIVAGAGVKVSFDGKGIVLAVKLDPSSAERHVFAIKCGHGSHYGRVKDMADGTVAVGETKIVYDERQKKWFAFISYTRAKALPPVSCELTKVLAAHRGVRCALTMLSSDGRKYEISGASMLARKRRLVARRRDAKRISRCERGTGLAGHGNARRFSLPDSLESKEAHVVRTWCQQVAANVTKTAMRLGCGTVLIEDYGGIEQTGDVVQRYLDRFPFYQLKQAIEWACRKAGLALVEVPSEYISTTCPMCGNADLAQHNHRTNMFHCRGCSLERGADHVAAMNLLKRVDAAAEWVLKLRKENQLKPGKPGGKNWSK
jgi:IS605 OrfB family transposase